MRNRGGCWSVYGLHLARNPEGAATLRELLDQRFDCMWLPVGSIAPVLGAHTGPSLVSLIYASLADFPDLP